VTAPRLIAASEIAIRPARIDDLEALTEIYLSSARHHVGLDPANYRLPDRAQAAERLASMLADRSSTGYLVAVVARRIVGSVTIALYSPTSAGSMYLTIPTAEIGIAVLDDARGAGIGSALMAAGETWAARRGVRRIVLDISSKNVDAVRLYERLGYQTHGLFMRKEIR
jgi:RimJ/RimL family protein N-acetyltransferase